MGASGAGSMGGRTRQSEGAKEEKTRRAVQGASWVAGVVFPADISSSLDSWMNTFVCTALGYEVLRGIPFVLRMVCYVCMTMQG